MLWVPCGHHVAFSSVAEAAGGAVCMPWLTTDAAGANPTAFKQAKTAIESFLEGKTGTPWGSIAGEMKDWLA